MNPAPVEATRGASAAAVADQWVQHMRAERAQAARHLTEAEQASQRRLYAATAWVARRPALCVDGDPCGYAVLAVLEFRRHRPDLRGDELVAAVQRRRAQRLDEAVRRGSFTRQEADDMLAGRWTVQEEE